jgi:glucan phosphorylase
MNPTTLGSATPPAPPEQIAALTELAMDLRWSWNHSMDELWRRLDPALWALTNHPSVVLQTVTRERLATALADAEFCQLLDRMLDAKRHAETAPRWFQERYPQVSRQIFAPLFPRWPVDEVPISYVTNGVHMPTWDSAAADRLWTEASGKERWQGTSATLEADLRSMPDEKLWAMRTANRKALVDYARETIGRQMTVVAAEPEAIVRAQARLDPSILTLGFARRFATYKRPNLLLHDPARLLRILNHPERPAQLILAGKAHPADGAGQALIQQWMQFIRQNEANARVVFLADYDMLLAERLVQGVDVWLNTPQRPWEACGTSGMKVLVNGWYKSFGIGRLVGRSLCAGSRLGDGRRP